jgi:hypothetical protein
MKRQGMVAAGVTVMCVLGAVGVAAAKEPDRVTVASNVINAAQAGQNLGAGEATGLANSVVGTGLAGAPPEAQPVANQVFPVLAVPPAVFDQLKEPSAQGYAALRDALAPAAAAANPQLNMAIDAAAAALTDSTAAHQLVQPFDTTMIQVGEYLIALEEK